MVKDRFLDLLEEQLSQLWVWLSFVLSWLSLTPKVSPGGTFVAREVFAIQGLVFEVELFLHGLGQVGTYLISE